MRKAPTTYDLLQIWRMVGNNGHPQCRIMMYGKGEVGSIAWVPARPVGLFGLRNRLRCAWLAFTGRADVVVWPQDKVM